MKEKEKRVLSPERIVVGGGGIRHLSEAQVLYFGESKLF